MVRSGSVYKYYVPSTITTVDRIDRVILFECSGVSVVSK